MSSHTLCDISISFHVALAECKLEAKAMGGAIPPVYESQARWPAQNHKLDVIRKESTSLIEGDERESDVQSRTVVHPTTYVPAGRYDVRNTALKL